MPTSRENFEALPIEMQNSLKNEANRIVTEEFNARTTAKRIQCELDESEMRTGLGWAQANLLYAQAVELEKKNNPAHNFCPDVEAFIKARTKPIVKKSIAKKKKKK